MKLVECVPNFSEGRRPEVVAAIRDAIAAVDGVAMLDVSSDASHNRTVITFVAPVERAVDAAFAGMREARARIDLTAHTGEHPRMGATDVVPVHSARRRDDGGLRRARARRSANASDASSASRCSSTSARPRVPSARTSPTSAAASSRGSATRSARTPVRTPDFGPTAVHPTAGATVAIGARPFLVAYNVYLGPASNLARREGSREGGARLVRRAALREGDSASRSTARRRCR